MTDLAPVIEKLRGVSTATLTTVLIKKGLRNVWIRSAMPLSGSVEEKVVGPAFTLRFIPAREDLATPAAWASPISTRAAIEAMPEGAVMVADAAGGVTDAGIFGDILCGRMKVKGAAALVTDGAVRDAVGVLGTELPVWCNGIAAPPSVAGLVFVGWDQPVGCGGVAIFPGDLIVADGDGAIVVPKDIAADIADEAVEQEAFEAWVVEEVKKGTPLVGLYPPNAETQARYRKETGRG